MVKAFAYGSGGAEIAGILQYHKIDYLGVAYADEGVELRKAGIHTPVMVMNPEPVSFSSVVEHRLEPAGEKDGVHEIVVDYRAGGVDGTSTFTVAQDGWVGVTPNWRFTESPLAGPKGNREFLIAARAPASSS